MRSQPSSGPVSPVLLVTGAAGGIGGAVAAAAGEAGYRVIGWDRRPPDALVPWRSETVDVSDVGAVRAGVDEIERRDGPVEALVHAAGVLTPNSALDPVHDGGLDAWRRSLEVNLLGTVIVVGEVARRMVGRGRGAIVGVGSNAGAVPRLGMAAYGAGKAAMAHHLRTVALEAAPHGVRCNLVSPGSTDTGMLRGMWPPGGDSTGAVLAGDPERFRLGIPLGRIASAADIAAACLFLVSPAAAHVTMHDLRVDGGATLDA